jgi:hypothetical protein
VALNCILCGEALPRDDARFCPNCGAPIVPRAGGQPSSQQGPTTPLPPAQSQSERKKPALREQIAEQPPVRSSQRGQDGASAKRTPEAGKGERRESSPVEWPAPLTHIKVAEATAIEDLPTREMAAAPTERDAAEKDAFEKPPDTPALSTSSQPPESSPGTPVAVLTANESHDDDVTQRDTLLLTAQEKPPAPAFLRLPNTPLPAPRLAVPLLAAGGRRMLWLVVAGLLCILVLGGMVTWIIRYQPFSVPAVTQPQQSFQDRQLGLALLYPNGWTVQVERGRSTVDFSDSSHTASVDIMVAPAGNGNLTQYLRQQAGQRGMTGVKAGAELSFAGTVWQQIQGSVLERGANFTETIFATIHNNHLVVLTQLAHQSIYAAEEKMTFSPLRASLRFV